MARTPKDVTDAELGVLNALWDRGASTIRQLTDGLYPDGGAAQYATVQKLLERLESKGYVRRDRTAPIHVFAAASARGDLIGRRLQAIADTLCGGSVAPLVSHLIQTGPLSAADLQSLRDLINDLDTRPAPRRRTGS